MTSPFGADFEPEPEPPEQPEKSSPLLRGITTAPWQHTKDKPTPDNYHQWVDALGRELYIGPHDVWADGSYVMYAKNGKYWTNPKMPCRRVKFNSVNEMIEYKTTVIPDWHAGCADRLDPDHATTCKVKEA